jgi:hypothetical protein
MLQANAPLWERGSQLIKHWALEGRLWTLIIYAVDRYDIATPTPFLDARGEHIALAQPNAAYFLGIDSSQRQQRAPIQQLGSPIGATLPQNTGHLKSMPGDRWTGRTHPCYRIGSALIVRAGGGTIIAIVVLMR